MTINKIIDILTALIMVEPKMNKNEILCIKSDPDNLDGLIITQEVKTNATNPSK